MILEGSWVGCSVHVGGISLIACRRSIWGLLFSFLFYSRFSAASLYPYGYLSAGTEHESINQSGL